MYCLRAAYASDLMQPESLLLLRLWKRNELRSVHSLDTHKVCLPLSFAAIRFFAVIRQTVKAPLVLRCPQKWVKNPRT